MCSCGQSIYMRNALSNLFPDRGCMLQGCSAMPRGLARLWLMLLQRAVGTSLL